jgi:cell division septal protein FtsQ
MIKFGSSKNKKELPGRRRINNADFVRTPAVPDAGTQFRRNQTLSGVRRPEDEPVSERTRMHRLARRRRHVGAIFALVLGVIIILGVLLSQFTGNVTVAGSSQALTHPLQPTIYEKEINDYLAIHPVERLRFALNEDALSAYVANALPEVSHVKLTSTDNIVDANFTMTFRKPVAGWQINGHQYYVDDTGVVFQNNYYETPTVQIVDQSGVSPEQGSIVASARLLSFVGRIVALSGQGSYTVTQAILPSGTTRELEIQLKDVQPLVKLSIDRGAGEQVEDMIRSLAYLKSVGRGASYIDVRVSGRAAYQ